MLEIKSRRVIGSNIEVDEDAFLKVLAQMDGGIVVTSFSRGFRSRHIYQVSFLEYNFFCEVKKSLEIPKNISVVKAEKIYNPLKVMS